MDNINDSDRISREMPEENPDRSLDPASGEALAAWEKEEGDAPAEKTADGERTVDDSTEEDEPEMKISQGHSLTGNNTRKAIKTCQNRSPR